ncbi:transporter, major facilitator family protein [Aeromicrobium marinum DSM 15272]|uniref:Transporter, major facilitator family protein n=2 Tax=Aeromicrobium marinum TaxID=219314 RepID=E2SCG3_9ACTN|nr:transporter, major facilitator family protein [Aeromicrobium marinum DSM 15272]
MAPLLVSVLVLFTAQQLLIPLLVPLSRELDLTETQLGAVLAVGALVFTVVGPVWGRLIDAWGVRATLLVGLSLSTAGLAGFAVVSAVGLDGSNTPTTTWLLLLVTRSLLFGAGVGAVPVAAIAAAGATTGDEGARTRAVGLVGAAQGASMVLGPAAGGLLAAVSLVLPLVIAPVVCAALIVWVLVAIPSLPRVADTEPGPREPGPRPWEPRFARLLVIGFFLYVSLAMVQIVIGFLVADRLGLEQEEAASSIGAVLVAIGVVLVVVQAGVVPRLRWPAMRLIRVGAPIGAAGLLLLSVADSFVTIIGALVVVAAGLGLAMPGFTAAPTLLVGPRQQGAVAGMITATAGTTFIIGPLLGTALYQAAPAVPVLVGAAACGMASVLAQAPYRRQAARR